MTAKSYSLLRIFTDELAMSGDRPVFEVILEKAKAHKLLGVTVLNGRVGFGHSKLIVMFVFKGFGRACPIRMSGEGL